jgi:hypothetical protein
MIAAVPPAEADAGAAAAGAAPGGIAGVTVPARQTHPTLFAMITTESSGRPIWERRFALWCRVLRNIDVVCRAS